MQAESEAKPSALGALQGLLNVLVRDGDGGFFINQEAIAEVNHASAVAGQCPILLQGEVPDDAEIRNIPAVSGWLLGSMCLMRRGSTSQSLPRDPPSAYVIVKHLD